MDTGSSEGQKTDKKYGVSTKIENLSRPTLKLIHFIYYYIYPLKC